MKGVRALTRELFRRQAGGVLAWGVSLGLLGALYVALFPSMGKQAQQYLSAIPAAYLQFLGIQASLGTPTSWLAMEMFNLLAPLALPFFSILMGARAVAGAEERGRLDVLLSNPMPRWQLVVGNFLTMAAGLVSILALMFGLTWVAGLAAGVDLGPGPIAAGSLNLLPFCLFFGALALLVSTLVRRGALAAAIPACVLVAMYVVNGVGAVSDKVRPFRPISLFYHYGSGVEDGVPWTSFILILAGSLALLALAVMAFQRREIYT
jgi:ABC-2 type transport system permease protein